MCDSEDLHADCCIIEGGCIINHGDSYTHSAAIIIAKIGKKKSCLPSVDNSYKFSLYPHARTMVYVL